MGIGTLKIRRAETRDAAGIMLVHSRSIREICHKEYTPEQIVAWSSYLLKENLWKQKIERDYLWVLERENQIFGFSHLAIISADMGEVMGLYLLPEVKNAGWGRKLMNIVQEESKRHHLQYLSLLSTLTAKPFYETLGFYQSDSDTTIRINGADIEGIPMNKVLK